MNTPLLTETNAVMTYQIAGLTIDVWPQDHPRWKYLARIRETGHAEEGHSAVQACERVFFDYCDFHVQSLVLKEIPS